MQVRSWVWEGSPGEGTDKPLQYSCLENPLDRGTWQATVQRVAKSQTWLMWLSMHKCVFYIYIYIYIYIWFRYINMCLCWVIQLCLILSDSMDCSPPGFSIYGIFQARILEWVAISSPGNLPDPGSNPHPFHLLHWQADSLPLCHLGSIYIYHWLKHM